jgi:hypothetical protein
MRIALVLRKWNRHTEEFKVKSMQEAKVEQQNHKHKNKQAVIST